MVHDRVEYWLDLAEEDISVVELLLNGQNYIQAGFFFHLIVEKALKALIASLTDEIPPKIHDLAKLAERGSVLDELSEKQMNLLKELNPLNIDARYPEHKERIRSVLTRERATKLFEETEEFLCWIGRRLKK